MAAEQLDRPVVRWFAEQMELALRRNDNKGGWHEFDPSALAERIVGEYAELEIALGGAHDRDGWGRVIAEAVDVANMAMMVADHYRDDGPSRDQGYDIAETSKAQAEGWIRVEQRMPTPIMDTATDEECWHNVYAPGRGVDMAYWDGERWFWRHSGYALPSEVTHWRPLPAEPGKEGRSE